MREKNTVNREKRVCFQKSICCSESHVKKYTQVRSENIAVLEENATTIIVTVRASRRRTSTKGKHKPHTATTNVVFVVVAVNPTDEEEKCTRIVCPSN